MSHAAEFRDPDTGAHIQRMAHYSVLIAARDEVVCVCMRFLDGEMPKLRRSRSR